VTMNRPLRILTLSTTFPNPEQPVFGSFVRSRALSIAERTPLTVVAPLSFFTGSKLSRAARRVQTVRSDAGIGVFHPRWLNIPGGSPINALLLAASVLYVIARRGIGFDILDVHFGYPDGVAGAVIATVLRKRFLVTLRGSELLHARYPWRRRVIAWSLRCASHVVAVSPELGQLAMDLGVEPGRITVVGNGVNTDLFAFREMSIDASCVLTNPKQQTILSVGNLIRLKGHDRIIRTLPQLVSRGKDVRLIIIGGESSGEPGYLKELQVLVEQLQLTDRVIFAGRLPASEVARAMNSAALLCLASEREGCPNVVREALACGTPVVATRVGAVPSMIPDERYGIIVPAGDEPALERALETALERRWDRRAISLWGASRTWKQVAHDVLRLMEQAYAGA